MEGDFALAALEDHAEVGIDARFLGSEASLDAKQGDASEEAMDFFGSGERTGSFGEVVDEIGGGIVLWTVAMAEGGIAAGNGEAAAAAGGEDVGAAGRIVHRSAGLAFHFGPTFGSGGGVPRCFWQRVRNEKKEKEMNGIRNMKEWGRD